jgi:hypothetical protein
VQWAVENLIQEDDKVVLFHAVKTPKKIPTASKWCLFRLDSDCSTPHSYNDVLVVSLVPV